ncbi:MAG: hypothetical protein PHQ23_02435 [Candidatus Wallbacteria bacterium]|nr:hypothetical protein [Candidatus Wallbacteria bacterium]
MNPYRMMIFMAIVIGVSAGLAGKNMVVTGYDFGFSIAKKSGFYLMPIFINLETCVGDRNYLKYDDVSLFAKGKPQLAKDLRKYLDAINQYIQCSMEQQFIMECATYYLNTRTSNELFPGTVKWDQIADYLPDRKPRLCPGQGIFFYYRDGMTWKAGCTRHTQQSGSSNEPRIGF